MPPRTYDRVVLVDQHDRPIGTGDKLEVHQSGRLHRAISVFVFNDGGDLLLQKRHADKYHSGGLWSNTCCTHPRPGEKTEKAAVRRLQEEMGFACDLSWRFGTVYRASVGAALIEHEYDHVYVGCFEGTPEPDPLEVTEWRWVNPLALQAEMESTAERFTPWFRLLWERRGELSRHASV